MEIIYCTQLFITYRQQVFVFKKYFFFRRHARKQITYTNDLRSSLGRSRIYTSFTRLGPTGNGKESVEAYEQETRRRLARSGRSCDTALSASAPRPTPATDFRRLRATVVTAARRPARYRRPRSVINERRFMGRDALCNFRHEF